MNFVDQQKMNIEVSEDLSVLKRVKVEKDFIESYILKISKKILKLIFMHVKYP